MKIIERDKAILLRKKGLTLNEIIKETGFSKASVSVWVRNVELTQQQKYRISEKGRNLESIEKRRLSRLSNEHKKTRAVIDLAKKDITKISLHELKIIGAMLYLGEGGKTKKGMIRLANSDPLIIQMIMRFYREVCAVPENRFYAVIHTFDNANVEKTEKYWAHITGIPRKQFYKTYVKQSIASLKKRKTLEFGTVDVGVNDTKLFLKIMGWIEKIKELVLES